MYFEDEETESTAQNSYNRRESAYLRDHLPEAFRRAIARFNDVDMVLYEQGVEQFYQQVTLARKSTVTLPASHLVPSKITLPAKDWESTWPFFQEQLPTTFFMRRVMRCRITKLASQCARLIGTSMPDGVDYMLQNELVELMIQAMSREFYQRRPEEFFEYPGLACFFFVWGSRIDPFIIKIPGNPNDSCFDWRRPCLQGLKVINRGHLGRRYTIQYNTFFAFISVCIILSYRPWLIL